METRALPLFDHATKDVKYTPTDTGFDICRNRHRGSPESVAANPSQDAKRASYKRILALLAENDLSGKEIAAKMGVDIHFISGRLSELRLILKKIEKTGERREKSAVLRLKI